ncbi:MAG: elongation factor G [Endomicrobiales bacterium]
MKSYATQDLRNVCIIGSQGDGKTSLAEALLFNAGVTGRLGRIEEGNTVADFSDDEIERKISINLSVAWLEHNGKKINLLTAPGYADFSGEACAGLAVSEAAVVVVGADAGVTPALENLWEYLEEKKIPAVLFLNKMDKENADFQALLKTLKERLSPQIVDLSVPDAPGRNFSSVINLLQEDIPEEDVSFREKMVEDISSGDDTLTEEYLEGKRITVDELRATLKKELAARKVFPLLCGSAARNIGVKELADFIVEYLPSPALPADHSHFSALVFKTISEPGMGQLNLTRIYSGTAQAGKDVYNFTRQLKERIGQMAFIQGKKRTDAPAASPGDLVALMKLKDARTNDVLGDEKTDPPVKHIEFPSPLYERAVGTQSKSDEEKVGSAMAVVSLENPTIRHFYNAETREMIVAGMGTMQLEIMAKRIKARFGVQVDLRPPRIPYKETIYGKAEVQGKYKRQSGGRGQYGDCWLKIEPLERGKGFEFVDKIVGGAIPRNYVPAVEKGVREAMEQGVFAGYPVVDLRVTVYDGSYHEVDSSDMAFKIAGAMALRKGFSDARPALLEPIMDVEVVVPDEYMGSIMGDLNSRRGRVLGMDKSGRKEQVKAQVPLGEMFQYATDLRSLTKGSGKFTMKVSHYEPLPPEIANPLVESYQKTRTADSDK